MFLPQPMTSDRPAAAGSALTPARGPPNSGAQQSINTASPLRADGLDRAPRLESDLGEPLRLILRGAYRRRETLHLRPLRGADVQSHAATQPLQGTIPRFSAAQTRRPADYAPAPSPARRNKLRVHRP